jgi:ElaB/YqjD/DUF883 family membrane-anchored ribosome-binding protein
MVEASRRDYPTDDVIYPVPAAEKDLIAPELRIPELPQRGTPASNPALNRSAEALGRGMGTAVAGVRNLPQRLRSRIHLVGSDQQGALTDSMAEKAAELRNAAEQKVLELKEQVGAYTVDVADRTGQRLDDFRSLTQRRINLLRVEVRRWTGAARHWEYEHPWHLIAGCAASAFVLGVALRIWRSNSD